MRKSLILVRIILIAIPLVFFGWLVDKNFAISKLLEVSFDFQKPSSFISFLKPEARLGELVQGEDYYQPIKGDPVYFELKLPNRFLSTAKVELTYKNKNQPIIELGLQKNPEGTAFELQPLENKYLDTLNWFYLENEETGLWQREKKYESVNDFFLNPPEHEKVAVYHYDYDYNFLLPGYKPSGKIKIIDQTIRGGYKFYTYIKDEPLSFIFYFQNVNRYEGADPITVKVYNFWGDLIYQKEFNDDGNASNDSVYSSVIGAGIEISADLPEGVYKVEVAVSDDIFTRKIETPQSKISFINQIYLGDAINYAEPKETMLYTNGSFLRAATTHEEGLQELEVNGGHFIIGETYKQYHSYLDGKQNSIFSPVGDIELFADGLFYFSPDDFINPELAKVDENFNPDKEGVDYIIAGYTRNTSKEEWKNKSAEFNLDEGWKNKRKVKFIISLPGLEFNNEEVNLTGIKATFYRQSLNRDQLFQILGEYPKKILNKVKNLWR